MSKFDEELRFKFLDSDEHILFARDYFRDLFCAQGQNCITIQVPLAIEDCYHILWTELKMPQVNFLSFLLRDLCQLPLHKCDFLWKIFFNIGGMETIHLQNGLTFNKS